MTRSRAAVLVLAGLLVVGVVVVPAPARGQKTGAVTVSTPGGDVTVLADRLEEVGPDNLLVATGNVEVTRGTARLTADRVEINRATGDAVAEGRAILYDGDDRVTGDRIEYNIRSGTGVVYHADARTRPYYRVAGERMERLDESRYHIRRGVFTTCEDDPPSWSFHFGDAEVDLQEWLFGTNASFWVKNVPLIPFLPFFGASLRRDRQTGFLFPRFGQSNRKGVFYEQPFFWAISESQDVTLTPDFYSKIGVGGSAEYRYILSNTNKGEAHAFFIRETRDQEHGQGHDANRGVFGFKHDWLLGSNLVFKADVNYVTDDLVFREFGDALAQRVAQRLESNVFLTKTWPFGNLVANVFWYQDLTTQRTVELNRLPDIQFQATRQPLPGLPTFLYELETSAVRFVREVGSDGIRIDLHPRVSHPIPVLGFFTATPFVGVRLTGYDKTVTGQHLNFDQTVLVEDTKDDLRLRRLLEAGSDFEARASRLYSLNGAGGIDVLLHSIEPHVTYTFIDGFDMSRLPQWTVGFDEIRRTTTGIDDIRKTSLLSYSVINRFRARTVAPAGTEPVRWELVRFTLGHFYDFENQRRPFGPVTADLIVDPNRIVVFRGTVDMNVYGDGLQTAATDVSVRLPPPVEDPLARPPLIVSMGTRYNQPAKVNFLQGSVTADVTRWAAARVTTNWDLRSNTFVENRYAADLRWQCWAFTVEFVSRVKDPVLNRTDRELRFTLNLLGLGAPLSTAVGLGTLGGAQPGGPVK